MRISLQCAKYRAVFLRYVTIYLTAEWNLYFSVRGWENLVLKVYVYMYLCGVCTMPKKQASYHDEIKRINFCLS